LRGGFGMSVRIFVFLFNPTVSNGHDVSWD
jgi:hypothetical protein